jgi:hypothetical protein
MHIQHAHNCVNADVEILQLAVTKRAAAAAGDFFK